MADESATDALRTPSVRTASVCPECNAPPGSAHAMDCVMRPVVWYQEHLRERYARRDPEVYRIGGEFVCLSEPIEPR